MVASPVSQKINAPVVLVPKENIQLESENKSAKTQTHENYLNSLNVTEKSYLLGGTAAVSNDCFTNIKKALLDKDLVKPVKTDRNIFKVNDYVVNNKPISLLASAKDNAKKVLDVAVNKILKVLNITDYWVNLSFNGTSGWVKPEGFKYYNPKDFYKVRMRVPNLVNQMNPKSQNGVKQKAAPIGCEPTAMYHALQAKGYALDYTYNEFLDELPMNTNDNNTGFSKNPYIWDEYYHKNIMATYMNPEPMTKFANRFANGKAENISGASMRDIIAEIQNGNTVMFYGTLDWEKPRWATNIYGQRFFANNHGNCINGYDPVTNTFNIAGPWYDNEITKSFNEVAENYLSRQMAVVVR
ncbi:MAG: C39 family peptidase [Finegoldia sp.]|nr:C39 family peptidase [Finegoldia sp.]